MRTLLIAALLCAAPACLVGVSAARTVPAQDPYCEPVAEGAEICRVDDGREWWCVAGEYGWQCTEVK